MRAFFSRGVRLSLSAAVVGAAALVLGAACGGDDGGDSGKVQVVTTLPLFADFVREVGGDRVEVTSLVPAGADPHTFEPSPSDVKKVAQADIAFANGLDLEPAAEKLIEANLPDEARFVRLAIELGPAVKLPPSPNPDPHLWMEPIPAKRYVEVVRDALKQVDAAGADIYDANAKEYLGTLTEMFDDISQIIKSVPEEKRKLVTTHDAFGRFASAFGLQIVAVVIHGPGQEPSPEDVANLTRTIEDQGVPAVFREPQLDSEGRVLEQAAKDAGVQVCVLYSDSLDDRVTSYIEMMRFNADEIARCLGGDSGG
jgi:ABC-type Zn uptake system ZnuABC Zn-binding protein ZnuA